jgi:hypothetical protein
VVTILCVIGDERAVAAVIEFMRRPGDQPLARAHHEARRAALVSLGYLINRTGSEQALSYLIEGLTPATWRLRNVQGTPESVGSYQEYDLRLSGYALEGLALSGHPRAGEALRALRQTPAPGNSHRDSTIAQWLEVHELVSERGVAGMYDHYEEQGEVEATRVQEEAQRRREEQQAERSLREAQRITPVPF